MAKKKATKKPCPVCGSMNHTKCTLDDPITNEMLGIEDSAVNHPKHYGGEDDPYEAIKVIEAWGLGFNIGNTVKYLARADKKGKRLEDLKKSLWYLNREIKN
ncbi:hypothetical protein LCGC14_1696000, partial [marine sediment metagenome]